MKKSVMIVAAFFVAMFVQAGNRTIVIRGNHVGVTHKTEVTSVIDTLTIRPAKDVEAIYVTLRDANDNIIEYHSSPACFDDCFTIITPSLPDGYVLEILDDKGTVYREEE
ncbi:MAG: hypothetical protein IJ570_04740 [Prevotella sp.]|nr:hypothetical protein [Prevotella sp.]